MSEVPLQVLLTPDIGGHRNLSYRKALFFSSIKPKVHNP